MSRPICSLLRNPTSVQKQQDHRPEFRLVRAFFKGGKVVRFPLSGSHSEFEEKNPRWHVVRTDSFGMPEEDALPPDLTINGLFLQY